MEKGTGGRYGGVRQGAGGKPEAASAESSAGCGRKSGKGTGSQRQRRVLARGGRAMIRQQKKPQKHGIPANFR